MFKGNQRYFCGVIINIKGDDVALNSMVDELDFVACAKIISRRDIDHKSGVLVVQAARFEAANIGKIAKTLGLKMG